MRRSLAVVVLCLWVGVPNLSEAVEAEEPDADRVALQWGVKIPLRDGVRLNATLYAPRGQERPAPCIVALTPYIADAYHAHGVYFAAHGYPFAIVDVRGRGNSEGEFHPFIQEAQDGYDVVEWLAQQSYCNGKVAMWGGSYMGYVQWVTAKERPPHLASIVPVAAPVLGVDFPADGDVFTPYDMQWLIDTSGHTDQDRIYRDSSFWAAQERQWFEAGLPLRQFDTFLGPPSPIFREWLSHPHPDQYWDRYNLSDEDYSRLSIPILTITGSNDANQPGALTHYRLFMKNASADERARHYLIIGPWDHAGTRIPKSQFGGLTFGLASLVDLPALHLQWYAWTMQGGPKPGFLKAHVAYYVMGAEKWRYAETLEGVTAGKRSLYLASQGGASDVFRSGTLTERGAAGAPDRYVYDPRDLSTARLEESLDPDSLVDQTLILARGGKELIYHSAPFDKPSEVSGNFQLTAWLGIDQPDTDFAVNIYELSADGSSIWLAGQNLRARYRAGSRQSTLVQANVPLRYEFDRFNFVSRQIRQGSRLRLVISPINSIYHEKNYNSGGVVAEESLKDARPVTVTLYHDARHPSCLYVPLGRSE